MSAQSLLRDSSCAQNTAHKSLPTQKNTKLYGRHRTLTFKTVNYERSRYTFLRATKARSTALFSTLHYSMVVINYCLKKNE